jgi:hypothetical protein
MTTNAAEPKDRERHVKEAWKTIDALLDQWFGKYIEEIVRKTKRPELRPKLKQLFFELMYLQRSIEQAKSLGELESAIDRNVGLLEERLQSLQKLLEQATEERKAAIRDEFAALKGEHALLVDGWETHRTEVSQGDIDPGDRKAESILLNDAEKTFRGVLASVEDFYRTYEHLEDVFLEVDKGMLTKELKRFKRWRKIRKMVRRASYFMWGVLILGVGFSLLQSLITGVVLTQVWWLLIITTIAACISLYSFSPWLARRDLETQRKHLLASVRDFYQANIQVTILAPRMEESVKKKKSRKQKGLRVR